MKRGWFAPVVAVVAFFGLSGVSTATTTKTVARSTDAVPTTSTPAPDGYHKVTVKKGGFSIAIPNAWVTLDMTRKDIDELFQRARKLAPELAASLPDDAAALTKQGVTLVAREVGSTDFNDNVLVTLTRTISSRPTPAVVRAFLHGLPNAVEVTKTTVAGVPAVQALTTNDVGTTTVYSTAYYVLGKKGLLQIAFSTGEDGAQDLTVQTMIRSLKLLG